MLQTCKPYACKYFYETTINRKKKLFVDTTYCDKFLPNGMSPKCYVDSAGVYYNLLSVNDGGKWEHPVRFLDKKLGDDMECVEEKE